MLDLEERATAWRTEARLHSTLSEEELDELETHLRDRVDALVAGGDDTRAAYETARDQLGDVVAINAEYRKVRVPNCARERLLWMLVGYVVFEGIQQAARLVATFAAGPSFPAFGDSWIHLVLIAIHALVLAGLVVVVIRGTLARGGHGRRPEQAERWGRLLRTRRWLAPTVTLVSLFVFVASAVAINYWQWWARASYSELSQTLGLTNFWLDLFEIAVAPTLAIAGIFLVGRSRAAEESLESHI